MKYKNKAHQAAFDTGRKAAVAGMERVAPYGCGSNSERYFRRAWLDGYDAGALEIATDAMRRADADALLEGEVGTTDDEWNRALGVATQAVSAAA